MSERTANQLVLMTLALLALLVSGCAAPAESSPGGLVSSETAREIRALLDADTVRGGYDDAFGEFVESCMASAGHDYEAVIPVGKATAGSSGFAMVASLQESVFDLVPAEDPNESALSGLDESEQGLWKQSLDRCQRDAVESVPTPNVSLSTSALGLVEDANNAALADKDYMAAKAGWGTCMSNLGFAYPSREAMYGEFGALSERFAGPFLDVVNEVLASDTPGSVVTLRVEEVLPSDEAAAYLDALDREKAVADADMTCGAGIDEAYDAAYRAFLIDAIEGA